MQLSIEILVGISLAVIVPLLGVIATCLIYVVHTLKSFNETLKKVDRSLDHNRNEHTKMIASINGLIETMKAGHQSIEDRIDLLEERIRKGDGD